MFRICGCCAPHETYSADLSAVSNLVWVALLLVMILWPCPRILQRCVSCHQSSSSSYTCFYFLVIYVHVGSECPKVFPFAAVSDVSSYSYFASHGCVYSCLVQARAVAQVISCRSIVASSGHYYLFSDHVCWSVYWKWCSWRWLHLSINSRCGILYGKDLAA